MHSVGKINIAIHGAGGRMGQRLVALTLEDPALNLTAAVEWEGFKDLGKDAGEIAGVENSGIPVTSHFPDTQIDVIIDFSLPQAFSGLLDQCSNMQAALVTGTTGTAGQDQEKLLETIKHKAILQAPNMSLGVNLLFALAGQVTSKLEGLGVLDDYDMEIVESHHRYKKDAPSGTALGIVKSICDNTSKDMNKDVIFGREGEQPRKPGEIAVHALRMGDVVGDHTLHLSALGERLDLRHVASSRDIFAKGALTAAKWLNGKPAGSYGMSDVLGL